MHIALIVALLLGLVSSAETLHVGVVGAAAATWYVTPTGNDQAACQTPDTACRTIGAAVAKAASGDRIAVAAGTYPERLALNKDLHLMGAGVGTTILDGTATGSVVSITTTTSITMTGVTIRNGASIHGGGILNWGSLTLTASSIEHNSVTGAGGGLYNWGSATLTMVTISDNTAINWAGTIGGGIYNRGTLVITNGTINNNRTESEDDHRSDYGGGIANGGTLILTNTTIVGNQAEYGGGIDTSSHDNVSLTNVTISGNSAIIHGATGGRGGGIYNASGNMTLRNVTLSDNIGWHGGNAIYSYGGWADNGIQITNTIVNGRGDRNCMIENGGMTSNGGNVSNDMSCESVLTAGGDRNNVFLQLGPLQDNGGSTLTHALRPGSPAIDAANSANCPTTDQRGAARPSDGNHDGTATCDIGAYELQPVFLYLPLVSRPVAAP